MAKSLKTFDELGLIVEDEAVTVTASCTGVNLPGLSVGTASYVAVVDNAAVVGGTAGTDYYTAQLEVSDAISGTYVAVGNVVIFPETASRAQIGFTSEQINDLVDGADYFRVTVTNVGTPTSVAYTAQVSMV